MTTPGYMPASSLVHLAGEPNTPQMRAYKPTAYAWERLHREAVRTDHVAGIAQPGGAYRSYADLVDIQKQWLGKAHKIDWHLNAGSGAMPSLTSVHGLGRCLDFTGSLAWIHQVAHEWGFTFPLVYLGDTNHGQHDAKTRGASDIYPYEVKRLARYLETRTHLNIGAADSGNRGGPAHTTNYWKALRKVVAEDGRQGKSLRSHHTYYLDLEAHAHAA